MWSRGIQHGHGTRDPAGLDGIHAIEWPPTGSRSDRHPSPSRPFRAGRTPSYVASELTALHLWRSLPIVSVSRFAIGRAHLEDSPFVG